MLRKLFLSAVLCSIASYTVAQDTKADFRLNMASYSPNTAAFLKYSDQPVSKYTGVPDITIPIYTIQEGTFSLPINLSYHAGGVRVEEEASWVGLGWSLNSGGQISRVVRGSDDFGAAGFYKTTIPYRDPAAVDGTTPTSSYPVKCFNGTTELYLQGFSFGLAVPNSFTNPGIDGEPDIFNFQAGKYSGRFIIDRPVAGSGLAYSIKILSPQSNLKITLITPGNTFTIVTPDGVTYEYAITDLQQDSPTDYLAITGKHLYDQGFTNLSGLNKQYISTWYLSKITLPNNRTIIYSYNSEQLLAYTRNQTITMLTYNASDDPAIQPSPDYVSPPSLFNVVKSVNTQKLLSSITFGGLTLTLNSAADRVDIKSNTGTHANRLTGVDVRYNSKYIKGIRLTQDYFNSGSLNADVYAKRLRLTQVAETDGTNLLPPYKFGYQSTVEGTTTNLPDKDSFNQDYWGYFNAKNNDNGTVTFLAPRLPDFYTPSYYGSYPGYQGNYEFRFSDRTVDARYAKLGTLNEIDYPTGGVEKFVYESNDFANVPSITSTNAYGLTNFSGVPVGYSIEGAPHSATLSGGGIRIQKILSYDCLSGNVKERRFDYTNGGVSSGKLMFQFVFYNTEQELYSYTPTPNSGNSGNGKRMVLRISSNSNYNLGNSAQGSPVGYSDVREYVNNNLFEEDFFENIMEKQYSSFYWGSDYNPQYPGGGDIFALFTKCICLSYGR